MGIDNGFNHNNKRILSNTSPSRGPQINPSKIEKIPLDKKEELTDTSPSKDTQSSNSAYSLFGINPNLISDSENLQISHSKDSDRSGPGNLPSRSSVTYDLSEVDLDDYDDDNSFTL